MFQVAAADATSLNKELRHKIVQEHQENYRKIYNFLEDRVNPYGTAGATKRYHMKSNQVLLNEQTKDILKEFEDGTNKFYLEQNNLKEKTK